MSKNENKSGFNAISVRAGRLLTVTACLGLSTLFGSGRPVFADSANVPAAAASMITCTAAGMPIAIVRMTGHQFVSCLQQYKSDTNSYKFWGAGCSLLVALGVGPIKGTLFGAKNAVCKSLDKPFSKEAFSLGELDGSGFSSPSPAIKQQPDSDKLESKPWGMNK